MTTRQTSPRSTLDFSYSNEVYLCSIINQKRHENSLCAGVRLRQKQDGSVRLRGCLEFTLSVYCFVYFPLVMTRSSSDVYPPEHS